MLRKTLGGDGIYKLMGEYFAKVPDQRLAQKTTYSMQDALSCALSVFSLKSDSLLSFHKLLEVQEQNIKTLYHVKNIPSQTQIRDIIDPVNPESLRPAYDALLRELQKGNELKKFLFMGHYPIALDGTGYFSSSNIKCPCCLEKKSKSDKSELEYHHQMLAGCIVHPDIDQVIPLYPEPIMNTDGSTKNDCERNAAKRWAKSFRSHHPKMPVVILEDSLSSNTPHLELLKEHDMRYLIAVKPTDHKYLFEQFEINSNNECTVKHSSSDETGIKKITTVDHHYEFISNLELNRSSEQKTNLLMFTEVHTDKKTGKEISRKNFSWITDLELSVNNAPALARLARRRWAIENETFQTLKKVTDYNIDHNFGHGKKYLSVNFALLCILAFGIDQALELSCKLFKEALTVSTGRKYLWATMRGAMEWVELHSWEYFFALIIKKKNSS